jgi:hypothetical protein
MQSVPCPSAVGELGTNAGSKIRLVVCSAQFFSPLCSQLGEMDDKLQLGTYSSNWPVKNGGKTAVVDW